MNLAIFGLTDVPVADRQTGGIASIYSVAIFANLSLWTQVFSLAIGLGSTRRSFFHGTCLCPGQSVLAGVVLTALHAIEGATDGWGVHMRFFGPWFLDRGNPVELSSPTPCPSCACRHWECSWAPSSSGGGRPGCYSCRQPASCWACGAALLVTWRDAWGAVGRFFTDTDTLALTSGYPLVLAVALGAAAWVVLRRVTP